MADEKKPDAKPAPAAAPERDMFVEIVTLVFLAFLAMSIINGITNAVQNSKLFSNGWRGLTPQGILLAHTLPISSLEYAIGADSITIRTTEVLNAPDGKKIGTQKVTARGRILQGPVVIEGERYWYVDFEKDPDGWVKESDIAYLESEPTWFEWILISLLHIVLYVKILLGIIAVVAILWSIYLWRKINELAYTEAKLLYPQAPAVVNAKNPKWERIQNYIESQNENDWRQAIIEADIMLGELLESMSIPGDTIGDKLKLVERSDFRTIDNAWEAHKVRNQIAHDGMSFVINQRQARMTIDLYESVFEEFQML